MMKHICPCCGYDGLDYPAYESIIFPLPADIVPPYENQLGVASYDVCACCGFEFGFDDNPGTASPVTFEEYRNDWLADGAKWFDRRNRKPNDWNLDRQLANIGVTYRPLLTGPKEAQEEGGE